MPAASGILVAIEVIEALSDYALPVVIGAVTALNKEGPVTMEDIEALKELVKTPESYFEGGE